MFGVPDVDVPAIPNIVYVPLHETDTLAREWFLVSYGLDYASALATEEKTAPHTLDSQRMFNGVWTFNLSLVNILNEWLTNTVDALPLNWRGADMLYGRQVDLMNNSMKRLTNRVLDVRPVVLAELQAAIVERSV